MGNESAATLLKRDPDLGVIAECCAGDRQAFNELVRRHKDRLYTVATQLLGDKGEAEDVTQDTFLKAYEKLEEFRGQAQFSTWLYRICHNLCLNRLAKRKQDDHTEILPDALPAPGEQLSEQLIIKERQGLVKYALSQLTTEFQEAIVLYYTGQLSYEEIASLLDLPVGTVRSRLHRGREQLKEFLRPYLQENQ